MKNKNPYEHKYFHWSLYQLYQEYTNDEEKLNQKDEDYLYFDFPEGTYTIQYSELKKKAKEEEESVDKNIYLKRFNKIHGRTRI